MYKLLAIRMPFKQDETENKTISRKFEEQAKPFP